MTSEGQALVISSSFENLARLRAFVETTARRLHAEQSVIDDLCIAVDEAVTNIIEHGYGEAEGEIEVSLQFKDGKLLAVIRDSAPVFNPLSINERDLSVSPLDAPVAGGYGLALITRVMDSVEHAPLPSGGNEIRMTKAL